jgi:predicted acetyltransferase
MTISVEPATPDEATLLGNLLELYLHDMSEVFPVDLGPDGRFGYENLSRYWQEPDSFPFLIRSGGEVLGFALVTRGSPATDDRDDLDVAEFFVLRRFRRSGVGRRAAFALWDRLAGRWVVRAAERNHGARRFWRAIIQDYTRGRFEERTMPGSPNAWSVFTFASPAGE